MADDPIKIAFSRVKEDILSIKNQLKELENSLKIQKEETNEILPKINEVSRLLEELKSKVSIGNEGVNQSINHLINQSINHQSINQSINNEKQLKMPLKGNIIQFEDTDITPEKGSNQSPINQSINHLINQSIIHPQNSLKLATESINKVFLTLTKQELKLFLTIYQLEEEAVNPTYKNISLRMQLSEHCVRSHVSSLLKKNIPIIKSHFNNRINVLSVNKDFKALNLKNKLINLYYDSDPNQKTLLDL